MKRIKAKPEVKFVSSVFPIFKWLECSACKEEFLMEKVWQFKVYHQGEIPGKLLNLCCGCAPTEVDANAQAGVIAAEYGKHGGWSSPPPMPKCKPPKPEGPVNEILHTSTWGPHRYSPPPPPPPPKRLIREDKIICPFRSEHLT